MNFYIAVFCLFLTSFVFIDDGSGIGRVVQAFCCLYLGVFLYEKKKYFFIRRYKQINSMIIALGFLIMCSTFIRGSKGLIPTTEMSSNLLGGLIAASNCFVFFFIEYVNEVNRVKLFCHLIYVILSLFVISINIDFLIHPPVQGIHGVQDQWLANFVGGKFWVSYNHLLWSLMYYLINQNKMIFIDYRCRLYLHFILTFYICIITRCNTALLGSVLVAACYFFKNRQLSIQLVKPKTFFRFLVFCASFFFLFSSILQIPFISRFITESLDRDITLSGRIYIYREILTIITVTPIFGLFDTHEVVMSLLHAPNLQNGLLQIYASYGIIYLVVWLFLIKTVLRYRGKNNPVMHYPVLLYIYFLVFISSVEVSFDKILPILALLILNLSSYSGLGINKNQMGILNYNMI